MFDRYYHSWRLICLYAVLIFVVCAIVYRLFYLSLSERAFLLKQSQVRILHTIKISAHRGMIVDRRGKPLAISTSMESVWVNPQFFHPTSKELTELSHLLHLPKTFIQKRSCVHCHLEFLYLKRRCVPAIARQIKRQHIAGVFFQSMNKRFYPAGEVSAQLVGLTNVNDQGQSGVELAYNRWLSGKAGEKKVLKDRLGHIIANIGWIKKPIQGHNLVLSIDQRLQFLAYLSLKQAMQQHQAKAGSIVVMNPKTGEVLAMVNQPSFNPNQRPPDTNGRYRNRALTDMYEPGSTMKPFTVTLALESGQYTPETLINTHPGWMRIGAYTIRDDGLDYGKVTLRELLQKSSNIAAAKIMLSLQPRNYWHLLYQMGFGQRTHSGFPGESPGRLIDHTHFKPSVIGAIAYGYGVAVTTLQLAHAYCILANHGVDEPVTLLKRNQPITGRAVIPSKIADTVVDMMTSVLKKGGTGTRARVAGYLVAGKTGTAYIAGPHGYDKHHYLASFVGMAPVPNPRLVVAVDIINPQRGHFGALAAAPAFAQVMAEGLRLFNIAP